jgi:hypothetical protein
MASPESGRILAGWSLAGAPLCRKQAECRDSTPEFP